MKEKNILKIARLRDFDLLEEEWMTLLEALPESVDDMIATVEWLLKVKENELAELFLSTLLDALEEQKPGKITLETSEKSFEWFPDDLNLRKVFARQFLICNSENSSAESVLKKSEIVSTNPYKDSLDYIQKRINLVTGTYVMHSKRRFISRIESYNPETDFLTLNTGNQNYEADFFTFSDQYNVISKNNFRALQIFDHKTLKNLAKENPVKLVKTYLKAEGSNSVFRDFKDAMTVAAVQKENWKSWWSDTHKLLVNEPFIDLGTGGQPSLTLRDTPRDFSKALRKDFDCVDSLRKKPVMVLNYLAELKNGVPLNENLISHFQMEMEKIINSEDDENDDDDGVLKFVAWISLCAINEELNVELPEYSSDWLNSSEKIIDYAQWCVSEHITFANLIKFLKRADENCSELFGKILPFAPLALIEILSSFLIKNEKFNELSVAITEIENHEIETAEAFAWLWKIIAEKDSFPIKLNYDIKELTLKLFKLIQRLSKVKEHDGQNAHLMLAALRHTVSTKKYTLINSVFKEFGNENSSDLYQLLTSNSGLSTAMRSQLVRLL